MTYYKKFSPKRTNIIIDVEQHTIHLFDNMEELDNWEILEVRERDFNIVTWKCKRRVVNV